MQFLRYAFAAFCLWIIGWIPSVTICVIYFHFVLQNYLIPIAEFWPIWHDPMVFGVMALSSAILLIGNIVHFLSIVVIAKALILWCEKISPTKELKSISPSDPQYQHEINVHHLRGFILRFVRFYVSKSLYPWWIPWAFNLIGVTRYSSSTVLEDQFLPFEMISTGRDVYIGQRSIVSSQLSEGQYGNLTIAPVKIHNNSVVGPACAISPGVQIGSNSHILPFSAALKYAQLEDNQIYDGLPVTTILKSSFEVQINHEEDLK